MSVTAKIQASVYNICLNEEENIARMLESVRDFDEVIVVDSGSTDRTKEIAAQFPNVVLSHQDWLGYAAQKEHAKSLCKHEWVLSLDSDQSCSPTLKAEIIKAVTGTPDFDALEVPISEQNTFSGKPRRFMRANTSIRFFRKALGKYNDVSVQESIQLTGRVKRTRALIHHFGHSDLRDTVFKVNKYSSLRAEDKFKKGKRPSLIKLTLVFPMMFFKNYFLKRGFLTGTDGFVSSMTQSYYAFLKEAKLLSLYAKKKASEDASDIP